MPETDRASGKAQAPPVGPFDTTAGSVVHGLFGYLDRGRTGHALALVELYALALALTFLPLLVGAALGPHSLVVRTADLKLPFLYDWTVLFAFLVSFPSLLVLTVTDQHVLDQSLHTVELEGTIVISAEDKKRLAARWNGHFRIANLIGQALAAIIGAAIAYINYRLFTDPKLGHWIVDGRGALLGVGYVFLFCLFLFYALVVIYLFRNIALPLLLKDIVKHARIQLLPWHPDRCGGLRSVGRLGLRNQYALSIFGVNVVLMAWVMIHDLTAPQEQIPSALYALMVAGIIAYLVLGPLVPPIS